MANTSKTKRTPWVVIAVVLLALSAAGGYLAGVRGGHDAAPVTHGSQPVRGDLPFEPGQDFEKDYAGYSQAERAYVDGHVRLALSRLPKGASEYDRCAAINAYLYQYFRRAPLVDGRNAHGLLKGGKAICGGAVATMSEMLYSIGIRSRYAFTIGGSVAHSICEVFLKDGSRALFDPYHGVIYFDREKGRPVSVLDISRDFETLAKRPPVLYAVHGKATSPGGIVPMKGLHEAYTDRDLLQRKDYDFEKLFGSVDAIGVANSGMASFVGIDLRPGQTIGERSWRREDPKTPKPWTRLATWERRPGDYLSWAYMLGQTMGYRIRHVYSLHGLMPGKTYVLSLLAARAYALKEPDAPKRPILSIQPVIPRERTRYVELEHFDCDLKDFHPRRVEISIKAKGPEAVIIAEAEGILILSGITLEEGAASVSRSP